MEKRLGRGLGSLLGSKPASDSTTQVAVDQIQPNPYQPREHFDETALAELRESIRTHGVLQPVVLRRTGTGLQLIAGERRWRASRDAGLVSVPAVIREGVTDAEMIELALVENLQREDLDPIERAHGYQRMVSDLGLTQAGVAERVGLKRSTVTNHLRLLELPDAIQKLVAESALSMGHARALLGIPAEEVQLALADKIVHDGMSVRTAEEAVREAVRELTGRAPKAPQESAGEAKPSSQAPDGEAPKSQEPWARALTERLQRALGTKVEIRNRPGYRGQILIEYFDKDGLEVLVDQLAPPDTI
ncbi:ParB/RepB/Spo0J family partition protein [Engelhardtia mirabilis]|uniref:Putative chromosome-partitioning protein ParB n=1 Tax=Engelhardtia mirabilis TaxID=2528011 RepID=A0A518BT11_9BACT|nr:putative chromosome-partitioning protein ParB [Planctomycetes bacterium Pla133]QDV04436.1 putative chromosome-partitioning protein ParB [Planctomycetes bacterium Pla86]